MRDRWRHASWYVLFGFAAAVVVVWYAVFQLEAHAGKLMLNVMDVGQGDAIFIESSEGAQVLVDGGPSDRVIARLGDAMPFWDRSIDLVILTHPDKDHIAGLIDVLRRYKVGMVLWSGAEHSSAEYAAWQRLLEEKNIPVTIARAGQRVYVGEETTLDVLAPFTDREGNLYGAMNDTSVVGRLQYGENSMLLMGDASESVERRLLFEWPQLLDVDVLKVGHHGSKTSTSEEFLRAVTPNVAVISLGGNNRYGHPHQEVMERLDRFVPIGIFRTDIHGDIRIVSDGVQYWIED